MKATTANSKGGFRGSHTGTFCQHLRNNAINVVSAYNWIAEAEGRTRRAQIDEQVEPDATIVTVMYDTGMKYLSKIMSI